MAYENLCMYCFEDMEGQTTCPHCGRDSRAAVPQIQMLPGSLVYHDRFLIGRALGQDASGIVYSAYDTKRENRLRIREYLPRDCAERLNDGAVVPVAGMEDQFEAGIKKLRASVENVEDPRKRHFFFEENGTAYIAQRKSAAAASRDSEPEDEEETGGSKRVLMFAAIAVAVLLVAAVLLITVFNGAVTTNRDITQSPTLDPSEVWIPLTTPTATPYVAPTFAALVDPELSWMDYTYDGDVEQEYQQAQRASATPKPTAKPTAKPESSGGYTLVNAGSSKAQIRKLQERLSALGWLDDDDISGKYDSATREAVRNVQQYVNERYNPKQKLSVDGVAGPKTQQWLYEADVAKPTPTPKPKVTPKPDDKTVDSDSSASQVRKVQQQLITLGLLPASAADGKYGATTRAAVRRFQTRVNQLAGYDVLEVTGTMDAQSLAFLDYYAEEWSKLRKATAEPTATPKPTPKPTATPTTRPVQVLEGVIDGNATKEQILEVQQLLADIGMLSKKGVDGIYGSATISAVADFQQWVNAQRKEQTLTVNGQVDQLTLLYLQYCKDHNMKPYATAAPKATPKPTAKPTAQPLELVDVDDGEPDEDPEIGEGEQEINIDEDSPEESIRYIQEMLSAVGAMSEDGIDGIYGGGTVSAVKKFQRWVNSVQGEGTLPENGKMDNRTRLALEYAYDHELSISDVEEEETPAPTEAPTEAPTPLPTQAPTEAPTPAPTDRPLIAEVDEPEEPGEPEEPEGDQEINIDENSETESIRFVQEMLNAAGLLDADDVTGEYDSATTDAVKRFQAWVNSARGKDTLKVTGKIDDMTRKALEYAFEHGLSVEQGGQEEEPGEPEDLEPEPPQVADVSNVEIAIGEDLAEDGVVTVSGKRVKVKWRAEGDVQGYTVRVEDGEGNTLVEKSGKDTSFTIETRLMTPGEVYTMRVGALPVGGTEDDIVWKTARFSLPAKETQDEEPPEVVPEEPDDEGEPEDDEPDPDPEPEPEPEPEDDEAPDDVVGEVSAPEISVAGVDAGSSTITIEDDSFSISWSAEGDVDTYYIRITDSDGKDMTEPQYTTQTVVKLRSVNMDEGEVYTLSVGAVPTGGTQDDMVVSRARFMRPVQETPEPTQVPTPAPQVAVIGKPVVNVGGTAYQQDGVSYMTGGSIIISWSADGDVENYTIYVENQAGEKQELGTTTDTSRTVSARSLPAGVYTIYVGAMPRGGGGDDIVWGSTRFGIPAQEKPKEEKPVEADDEDEDGDEEPDAPDDAEEIDEDEPPEEDDEPAEAMSVREPISNKSDADTVQQLQMKLYSLGLLSTDGLEPGVLDTQTLQAVAEFQTRMNEQQDAGFDVVDPGDLSSVVDAATVTAIFSN